ncbi:MAG TPA: efflux RND transporter periplasmic adaptor subunit [Polyangiaceae bacterium]|jgi:multidrug efflux system membrane fusion protein
MNRARLASAVLSTAILLPGCRDRIATPAPHPTAVKVATVDRAGAGNATRYSAQIEPATRVDLAFKVGGYVESIAKLPGVDKKMRILQEGDAVRSGMEVAAIRRTDYVQKVGEAQAAFAQAKAAAEQADLDFERVTKLVAGGSVSQAEADTARIKRDSAHASLEGAKVRVDEGQTALQDTSLRSPIDGVVLKRAIEVGTLAAPGTVGFSVAQVDRVKAVFGVPDTVLPRVHLGASQVVTTEAFPNQRFPGQISRISPSADPKSRAFEVEVTIPNVDQKLKTGMVAALAMADGAPAKPEPLVPLTSIVRSPGKAGHFAVFVVDQANGKSIARARDVELGEYLGRVIPVTSGLQGGEEIVVQGAGLLSDGEPVEVIP